MENDFKDFSEIETVENYKLKKYGIQYIDGYDEDTIKRRINRFRNDVYNNKEKILFMIKCHTEKSTYPFSKNISFEDSKKLRDLLEKIKNDNNFILLVVNESYKPVETVYFKNLIFEHIHYVEKNKIYDCNIIVNCNFKDDKQYDDQWIKILKLFLIL